jgi:hypothetical protein
MCETNEFSNIFEYIIKYLHWTGTQFLSLDLRRMVHSILHLCMPSDRPIRKIYMRRQSMNFIPWYELCLQIGMQQVRDVSGLWTAESLQKEILAHLCECFRRSEEPRELAVHIGVKSLHERHKWGALSGTFIRLHFPRNRKRTYIFISSQFNMESRFRLTASRTPIWFKI